MKSFPKNMKMQPIDPVMPNLSAFFTIRINAFQADLQKFLLVNAIYKMIIRLKLILT
jgi:hypothetical protein